MIWFSFCWPSDGYVASLVAQMLKHLPAMRETMVQPLGQEDPLEKEMATHSSILAWRIPWTEEPGWLQSMQCKEWDMTEWWTHYPAFSCHLLISYASVRSIPFLSFIEPIFAWNLHFFLCMVSLIFFFFLSLFFIFIYFFYFFNFILFWRDL